MRAPLLFPALLLAGMGVILSRSAGADPAIEYKVQGTLPIAYDSHPLGADDSAANASRGVKPAFAFSPDFLAEASLPLSESIRLALRTTLGSDFYEPERDLSSNLVSVGTVLIHERGPWTVSMGVFERRLYSGDFGSTEAERTDLVGSVSHAANLSPAWDYDTSFSVTKRFSPDDLERRTRAVFQTGPTWKSQMWEIGFGGMVSFNQYDVGNPAPRDLTYGVQFDAKYKISKEYSLAFQLVLAERQSNLPEREYRQLVVGPAVGFKFQF
jgi:hypothetical protein